MNVATPLHAAADSSLALAVIASSKTPVLLLDGNCKVVSASRSFARAFHFDADGIANQPIASLGGGEWAAPQLDALLRAAASGSAQGVAYEMNLDRRGHERRLLELTVQKLAGGDAIDVRLLLTVTDLTDARAAGKIAGDLMREKDILLQELQHRVANSLQIIASVLMQSARRVQSDETRLHLHDAHSRVMSVAAVQRQLAASTVGTVELRPYFTDLCRSIGASMISDRDRFSIDVEIDESVTVADMSVSLGLIVTELVINALKHAFPDHAKGRIQVGYRSAGATWTLSVSDDGVGMPPSSLDNHPGLGTSIVEALARKLGATVEISEAKPGTMLSIVHL